MKGRGRELRNIQADFGGWEILNSRTRLTCGDFLHATFSKRNAYVALYVNVLSQKGLERNEQETFPEV